MKNGKILVGITHGDINGVGYEIILKLFSEPMMLELCTPIIYGSPKVATYHRKAMELTTNFVTIQKADEAVEGRLNLVDCLTDEVKIDFGQPSAESGKAALAKCTDSRKMSREICHFLTGKWLIFLHGRAMISP